MIDAVGLIQDLRALLGNCSVIDGLDDAVEYRSNTSRREATVEAINKVVQVVDESYRRQALVPMLEGTYLVHSRKNALGGSNISVVPDINIRASFEADGDSWVNRIDGGVDRFTYYGEFGERVARLRGEILSGRLDSILGFDATIILHGVSGLSGELLPAIGWEPLKGETYTRFANDPFLKTMRDLDAAYERLAKTREETGNALQNFIKAILPKTEDPNTKALEVTDYKVRPRAVIREATGNLDDLPEALPGPASGSDEDKQPTHVREKGDAKVKPSAGEILATATPDSEIAIGEPKQDPIGIVGFTVTSKIAIDMSLEETRGVLVIGVLRNSLAEKADLRAGTTPYNFDGTKGMLGGDIINGIEGQPLNNVEELRHYLSLYHVEGTKITFNVLRDGKQVDIKLIY